MADYLCASRTSYFRVKDEEEFKKVVGCILGDVELWEQVGDDGIKRFAIGGYDNMTGFEFACELCSAVDCNKCEYRPLYDKYCGIKETAKAIQLCLPDDEVAFIFEVGNEKLRYVFGWVCFITAREIRFMDLHTWAAQMCEQRGLPVPQMDY